MKSTYSDEVIQQVIKEFEKETTIQEIAKTFHIPQRTVRGWIGCWKNKEQIYGVQEDKIYKKPEISDEGDKENRHISVKSLNIQTADELISYAKVDTKIWEVDRYVVNSWEVTIKGEGEQPPSTYTNYQVKIWLKRKKPEKTSLEHLLEDLKKYGPIVSNVKPKKTQKVKHSRICEISILDPHLGLQCFAPAADMSWDMDKCEEMIFAMIERLLELVQNYGPFEKILFPFGNDFLHADTVYHTTTEGTGQPEMISWHQVYLRAKKLAIGMIERMKKEAPVDIVVVMGNHGRQTEFTLGQVLDAYYHNDSTVNIDASPSPYKFYQHGKCLIGYEHGHSIRQTIRLAALMANETRLKGWKEARYCEWHLGDQHRKGSCKPIMMEEQGVSVEFLPGLTPPNEWHRIKSFNWQKRAGMAFIWDKDKGPIARMQVNIDNYTGEIM